MTDRTCGYLAGLAYALKYAEARARKEDNSYAEALAVDAVAAAIRREIDRSRWTEEEPPGEAEEPQKKAVVMLEVLATRLDALEQRMDVVEVPK